MCFDWHSISPDMCNTTDCRNICPLPFIQWPDSCSGQTHALQVRRYELTEDCGCRYVLEGDELPDDGGNERFGGFPVSANFSSTRSLRL